MMKKLNFMVVMLMIVVIVFTACSNQSKKVNSDAENSVSFLADENETVSFSASETDNNDSKIVTETESSTEISTTETTTAQSTTPKETEKTTAVKPDDKKSAGQSTTKRVTSTHNQTTTQKQTATQKVTTTQKTTTTTEKSFNVNYWVSYAKDYARSVSLEVNSAASDCWDNPISANSKCVNLKRDIQSRINRYSKDEDITQIWVWAEKVSADSYNIYIGYA